MGGVLGENIRNHQSTACAGVYVMYLVRHVGLCTEQVREHAAASGDLLAGSLLHCNRVVTSYHMALAPTCGICMQTEQTIYGSASRAVLYQREPDGTKKTHPSHPSQAVASPPAGTCFGLQLHCLYQPCFMCIVSCVM